jgi:hypothetical protein
MFRIGSSLGKWHSSTILEFSYGFANTQTTYSSMGFCCVSRACSAFGLGYPKTNKMDGQWLKAEVEKRSVARGESEECKSKGGMGSWKVLVIFWPTNQRACSLSVSAGAIGR